MGNHIKKLKQIVLKVLNFLKKKRLFGSYILNCDKRKNVTQKTR